MRVRLRFTKIGKVRFVGHRDVARILERALRRAGLPLAMTEGFSPRPKVHFGLALSTGHESLGEYLDVDLRDDAEPVALEVLPLQLSALLPPGLEVTDAAEVDRREPSLQQAVTSCTWQIDFAPGTADGLAGAAAALLARDAVPVARERKGKVVHDDLRPNIVDLAVDQLTLHAELSTQPRGVRPAELLAAFDPPLPDPLTTGGRICRTHQWITVPSMSPGPSISTGDGAKREPLHATPAPHAQVRAS